MKIVLFLAYSKPYGGERVAIELGRAFTRCGHQVVFVSYYADPSFQTTELLGPLISYTTLDRRGRSVLSMLHTVVRFRRLIRRERPDVVLSFMPAANLIACLATAGPRRTPLVLTEHSLPSQTLSRGRLRPLTAYKFIVRLVYRLATRVVAVSEAVAIDLASVLGRSTSEIRVIPNPVDADRIRRLAQDTAVPLPWEEDKRVLVSVAGLNYAKRPLLLLNVLRSLPDDVVLVMVGDGPMSDEVRASVGRLQLEQRVVLTGWLDNPHPVVAAADAMVLVSGVEGFGLVVAEAAALGVPSVTTAAGGLGETTLTAGGVVVDSDDPSVIAAEILKALADPPAARFAPVWLPDAAAASYVDVLNEARGS